MDDPLIYVRAIHFAATLLVAGVVFSTAFISEPSFRGASDDTAVPSVVRCWSRWLAWSGLVLALISGAAWLVLTAAAMSGVPWSDVMSGGALPTVLTQTSFGRDWIIRFALLCALAASLPSFLVARGKISIPFTSAVVVTAAAFTGTLAWAGHAAGGLGAEAILHPAADVLHLVAAAAWLGALPPLLVLFAAARDDKASLTIARSATLRFSTLGMISVATLLLTGIINTWYLSGSVAALTQTDYGRLLLEKIAVFIGMLLLAAANRLWLTPQLQRDDTANINGALYQFRYHVSLEIAAGLCIVVIVAALGTMHPGLHEHVHMH